MGYYGGQRNRSMEVVGTDPWGRQLVAVGAPRPVGNNAVQAYMPPGQMTPAQAQAILAQFGVNPGNGQNYLPMMPPSQLQAPQGPAPNPSWRDGEVAPGVQTTQEGMVPLPLVPQQNGGIFTGPGGTPANVTQIIFQGSLQKPYRAERLLVQVARIGSAATAGLFLQAQIFVGTDLQQGDILPIYLEPLGGATAFGTRLTLMQAPPGVLIRLICSLTGALTTTDTFAVNMQFLGRIIH